MELWLSHLSDQNTKGVTALYTSLNNKLNINIIIAVLYKSNSCIFIKQLLTVKIHVEFKT